MLAAGDMVRSIFYHPVSMNFYRHALCFVLLICCGQSGAVELKCQIAGSSKVASLDQLPASVQALLGRSKGGYLDIADIGGEFNPGCIVVDPPVPQRRLVRGTIGQQCIQLVVEYGGIAHYEKTLEFQLDEHGWRQVTGLGIPKAPMAPPAKAH